MMESIKNVASSNLDVYFFSQLNLSSLCISCDKPILMHLSVNRLCKAMQSVHEIFVHTTCVPCSSDNSGAAQAHPNNYLKHLILAQFCVLLVCHVILYSGEYERDIFNEKPSKEEQLNATEVCIVHVYAYTCMYIRAHTYT